VVFLGEPHIRHTHTWLDWPDHLIAACSWRPNSQPEMVAASSIKVQSFYSLTARVRSWPVSSALIFV
jgi:hypothetical protein